MKDIVNKNKYINRINNRFGGNNYIFVPISIEAWS
jgi:hypothetical protein